jgi:hypothetical protein
LLSHWGDGLSAYLLHCPCENLPNIFCPCGNARIGPRSSWIQGVIDHPEREVTQADGRIRRWAAVSEAEGKYLRVILLPDRETVHNAFFDRRFVP